MTVKEIVTKYIQDNKCDGLFTYDCGCRLDDLIPCTGCIENCRAGVDTECPGIDCEYYGVEHYHLKEKENENA